MANKIITAMSDWFSNQPNCHHVAVEEVDYLNEDVPPYVITFTCDFEEQDTILEEMNKYCTEHDLYFNVTWTDEDDGSIGVVEVRNGRSAEIRYCQDYTCRTFMLDADNEYCCLGHQQ
jgi:hypothetical protein